MSTINFTPTAYTVKDPGNGKERRYEATHYPQRVADAQRVFTQFADYYPTLAGTVVPDHFIQLFCQEQDASSWSGIYGVSFERQQFILLTLLEEAAKQNRFS